LLDPDAIINKSPEKVVGRRHPKEEIYTVLSSIVNYISLSPLFACPESRISYCFEIDYLL